MANISAKDWKNVVQNIGRYSKSKKLAKLTNNVANNIGATFWGIFSFANMQIETTFGQQMLAAPTLRWIKVFFALLLIVFDDILKFAESRSSNFQIFFPSSFRFWRTRRLRRYWKRRSEFKLSNEIEIENYLTLLKRLNVTHRNIIFLWKYFREGFFANPRKWTKRHFEKCFLFCSYFQHCKQSHWSSNRPRQRTRSMWKLVTKEELVLMQMFSLFLLEVKEKVVRKIFWFDSSKTFSSS